MISPSLWYFVWSTTDLVGEFPLFLIELVNLEVLELDWNLLTGEIPDAIGKLSKLRFLSLKGNRLTGEIPTEMGQLRELTALELGHKCS